MQRNTNPSMRLLSQRRTRWSLTLVKSEHSFVNSIWTLKVYNFIQYNNYYFRLVFFIVCCSILNKINTDCLIYKSLGFSLISFFLKQKKLFGCKAIFWVGKFLVGLVGWRQTNIFWRPDLHASFYYTKLYTHYFIQN